MIKLVDGALNPTLHVPNKDVKEYWSSMDPWKTPLITGIHLDIELLTATQKFWVQPSSQFLIHRVVHPSVPCLSIWKTRMFSAAMSNTFLLVPLLHTILSNLFVMI